MQNSGVNGGGGGGGGGVKAEDVISKLKDDGDFDRLRLKIIRKLKENVESSEYITKKGKGISKEELRSNIISLVRQSSALNRPGAENMKPRQLSDAIHQEIGDKLMSQISDGVWNIIRSADGMKSEITETVQSIYDKLSNPHNGESSSWMDSPSIQKQFGNNGTVQIDGTRSDGELHEPPGNSLTGLRQKGKNSQVNQPIEGNKGENSEIGAPPGFSSVLKHKNLGVCNDEDPDVPPGFGSWKLMRLSSSFYQTWLERQGADRLNGSFSARRQSLFVPVSVFVVAFFRSFYRL